MEEAKPGTRKLLIGMNAAGAALAGLAAAGLAAGAAADGFSRKLGAISAEEEARRQRLRDEEKVKQEERRAAQRVRQQADMAARKIRRDARTGEFTQLGVSEREQARKAAKRKTAWLRTWANYHGGLAGLAEYKNPGLVSRCTGQR
jgi:uncharacterized protein HemX